MRKIWNYRQLQNQQTFELLNNRQMAASYGEFMPMQQANGKTAAGIYHNGTWYNSEPFAYQSYGYQPLQTPVQVVQQQQQPEPYNNQPYCYQPVQAQVGQLPQLYHQPKPLTYDPTAYNCQAVQLMQPTAVPQQAQQFATANQQPYFYQPYNSQQPVPLTAIQTAANIETFNMQPYSNQAYHLQPVQLNSGQGAPQQSESENINYQSYDGQSFNFQAVQLTRKKEASNTKALNLPTYDNQPYDFEPIQTEQLENVPHQLNAESISFQQYQEAPCDFHELDTVGNMQQPLEATENLKKPLEQTVTYAPPYDCQMCKQMAAQNPVQMPAFGSKEASEFSTIQIDLSVAADVIITRTQLKLVVAISKRPGCAQGKTELIQANLLNESTLPPAAYKKDLCSFPNQAAVDIPVEVQPQTEASLANAVVENVEPVGEPPEPGKVLNGMQSSMESLTVFQYPVSPTSNNHKEPSSAAIVHDTEAKSFTQFKQYIEPPKVECVNLAKNMPEIMQQYRAPRRTVQRYAREVHSQTESTTSFDQTASDMGGPNATTNIQLITEDNVQAKSSELVSKILSINCQKKTENADQPPKNQKPTDPEKLDHVFPPLNSKVLKNVEHIGQEANKAATKVILQKMSTAVTSRLTSTPTILKRNSEIGKPDKTVKILTASSAVKSESPQTPSMNLNSTHTTQTVATLQAGTLSKPIVSNSNAVKIPEIFQHSQENCTSAQIFSQKQTKYATKNFSAFKKPDNQLQPEKSHFSVENSTENHKKSYTVYAKSKIHTTTKDNKIIVPQRADPESVAAERNVEQKPELPLSPVLHKYSPGKNTFKKTNEKVTQKEELTEALSSSKLKLNLPQKQEVACSVNTKELTETLSPKFKLNLPQKRELPMAAAASLENLQGKPKKIVEPYSELSVKLTQTKIKLAAAQQQQQEMPPDVATLKSNKNCPETIDTTKSQSVPKQKLHGSRPQKNATVSIPKPKGTKIDTLILNALSDKTETAPFGSRQQNQSKKQQQRISKLERKVLRRQAKKEQEQILAEKKAQDNINTKNNNNNNKKNNNKGNTNRNIQNGEVDKTDNAAAADPSESANAEIDNSPAAQYLEMKGLADPHIRRSLARIIQKITKL